uniref:Transmembrane protein n=1 Tax=Cacopsylla melanoneura TaxID=428564 RepID=A0A8D9E5T3_9HEMI
MRKPRVTHFLVTSHNTRAASFVSLVLFTSPLLFSLSPFPFCFPSLRLPFVFPLSVSLLFSVSLSPFCFPSFSPFCFFHLSLCLFHLSPFIFSHLFFLETVDTFLFSFQREYSSV